MHCGAVVKFDVGASDRVQERSDKLQLAVELAPIGRIFAERTPKPAAPR